MSRKEIYIMSKQITLLRERENKGSRPRRLKFKGGRQKNLERKSSELASTIPIKGDLQGFH